MPHTHFHSRLVAPLRRWGALAPVALLMLVSVACQAAPRVGPPLTNQFGKDDLDAQMEFWHRLGDRPMVTNDDAMHGVLLYSDGKDGAADYPSRVAALKARKMLPAGFSEPADEAAQRGTLAVAIVRVLDVHGGLMMHLTGPTPRYAVRELQYLGLYPESSPNQTFSGREFVGVMGRIEDYQRGNSADKPAAALPSETAAPVK